MSKAVGIQIFILLKITKDNYSSRVRVACVNLLTYTLKTTNLKPPGKKST